MGMPSYEFVYGPKLIAGSGSAARLGGLLPPGRCLFVTDEKLRSLGLAEASLDSLAQAGIEPIIYDSVEQDPSLETLL